MADTTTAPTATDTETITKILADHQSGPRGCTCGAAPDVFWERELHTHIAEVMVSAGWARSGT